MRRLLAVLTLALVVGSSRAEHITTMPPLRSPSPYYDPGCQNCPTPYMPPYAPPTMPQPPVQPMPGTPSTTPTQPTPTTPQPAPQAPAQTPDTSSFSPITSAALGDAFASLTAPGYLDPAAPANVLRLRYDSEYHINRPDRAEFFYAKCGCFPGAPGVPLMESGISAQELQAYIEYAPTCRWSVFFETPYRIINPEVNANANGIGDVRFGGKLALFRDDDQILSLQVKGYAPTGDARLGLGTDHYTVEPSFLYWGRLTEKIQIYGQAGIWCPFARTEFAGEVLEYGAGISYTLLDNGCWRLCPIFEALGWTVLSGQEFTGIDDPANTVFDAAGTTIVNLKLGARLENNQHSIYVGYGRAVTNEFWYRDILRVEYRLKY
jgi:hypothetical protein